MTAIVAEISPYDPQLPGIVTLSVTNTDDARVTALNGTLWIPAIVQAGQLSVRYVDPTLGGRLLASGGEMLLSARSYPLAGRYVWADAITRIWAGTPGQPWPWQLVYEGLVGDVQLAQHELRLRLRSYDAWLERPLLATYAGTGGLEGPAELRGVPKPMAIGAPRYCEPVLIDPVANVYQVHGYGPVRAITHALERLVRFGASSGNFATLAALTAASIPAGGWATCLAHGLVRFGAPPVGTISLLVEGDNGGADGWVRLPGVIIRRLSVLAGLGTALLDTANLAALDAALPYPMSRYYTDQLSIGDAINEIAAAYGAAAGIGLGGKLQLVRPSTASPALTLRADGSGVPQVGGATLLGTSAPWWRIEMGYAPTWRVHSADETAYSGEIGENEGRQPWAQVAGPGRPEDNATRQDPRGIWGEPVAYERGDMVHYQGQAYHCDVAHTSSTTVTPLDTTRWTAVTAIPVGTAKQSVAIGSIGNSSVISRVFANGESLTVRAQIRNSGQGTTTCTLTVKIQQRLGSTGSWSDLTSVASDTSDTSTFVTVSGTASNSSGGDRVQEYRAVSTLAPTAGSVDTTVSFLVVGG